MYISPNYTNEDWRDLDLSKEKDWQKAIDIFEDRIKGRFLEIIDTIQGLPYSGFAVLALNCLLIETLQQFRKGQGQTPRSKSKEYFSEFLTERFRNFFNRQTSEMFYNQIRCGILHQAEVKKSSRVLIREGVPLVSLADDGEGLVINRKLFHKQLVHEFEKYVSALQGPSNVTLRANFKKKMDRICRVLTL